MLSIGVIGSSGYTGNKLIKILNNHNQVKDVKYYSAISAGKSIWDTHGDLDKIVPNKVINSLTDIDTTHDVIFTALPHGISMEVVYNIFSQSKLIIDISGDYRFKDSTIYKTWYGYSHKYTQLLNEAVYSLADIKLDFKKTKLISNPGCYPTAVTLGLIPLVKEFNKNINSISTVAYSGISGAGKKLKEELLFTELYNNVSAYKINKHQHEPEILQTLDQYGFNSDYSFTPHLMPLFSGIYSTSICFLNTEIEQETIDEIYHNFYSNSFFIRIKKNPPKLKDIINTNFCDININASGNKIVVTASIDNLIKGAAGQAVQNMNNYFNFESYLGLI